MTPLASRIFTRVKRRSTYESSTPSSKDSDELEDGQLKPQTFPLLSQLYDEAGEFEQILLKSGCMDPKGVCANGSTGFINLIGNDLSKGEQAVANRDAKVRATSRTWLPSTPESGSQDIPSDDISNDDDTSSASTGSYESGSDTSDLVIPSIHRPVIHDSAEDLKPEDIVKLLVEEFGSLDVPGDDEKLLLETDGCLLHDVAIVGVIHLTTHRLSFHASLFATRPDLAGARQVIKAGPATMHKKGWRGKRRVWLELSADMICAYSSSKEQDRWRPLSSLLLAFVKDIEPFDPKKPRFIRLAIDSTVDTSKTEYAEFDTEESARDWRREFIGALFNFRHLRREAYTSPAPESNGVRLSLPLTQITKLETMPSIDFHSIVALTVKLSASDFLFENEVIPDSQTFTMGPIQNVPLWQRLGDIIAESKLRQLKLDAVPISSPVVVDFGPYNFFQNAPMKNITPASRDEHAIRFVLGFPADAEIWITRARIYRTVTCTGYFVIAKDEMGFWSKNITQQDVKYRIPISHIKYVKPFNLSWLNVEGVTLGIEGKPDAKFVFKTALMRDEVIKRMKAIIEPPVTPNTPPIDLPSPPQSPGKRNSPRRPTPMKRDTVSILAPLSRSLAAAIVASTKLPASATNKIPKAINIPSDTLFTRESLHFVCLTIGSRGDVQPYIALGLGLMKEGHTVTIVTHEEYGEWITGFGINHRVAGGDPGALMKLSVENKMFSPDFFRESLTNFRPWLDQLLLDSWAACFDADVLLESPSAMAGVHIAEALNIPYFRCFTMPWTKTSEFPHAFLSSSVESPTYNAASYVLYGNVIWAATSNQINRWRRKTLRLENTDMGHLAQSKITFIYNFSKAVVPKPLDWPDTTIISGYWFLDNPELNWIPPPELLEWMAKAREDKKPIVYIGFGSVTVPRPNKVTAAVVKAVLQSDVRAIISKGWSARMSKGEDKDPEVVIPPECYLLDRVPHDWLFPRVDAALHHGGAGTTGASLRAGIPTLIRPWFGDQYFWASRVQKLGAGLRVPSLHANDLADALTKATRSESMKAKAKAIGEQIRQENGVHATIHAIYTYLHRAAQDRSSLE